MRAFAVSRVGCLATTSDILVSRDQASFTLALLHACRSRSSAASPWQAAKTVAMKMNQWLMNATVSKLERLQRALPSFLMENAGLNLPCVPAYRKFQITNTTSSPKSWCRSSSFTNQDEVNRWYKTDKPSRILRGPLEFHYDFFGLNSLFHYNSVSQHNKI